MSTPVTHTETAARIRLTPANHRQADGHRSPGPALVLAGANVVVIEAGPGGRAALFTFVERLHRELVTAAADEHEQGLHAAGPEIGCPVCEAIEAVCGDLADDWVRIYQRGRHLQVVPDVAAAEA